MAKKLGLRKLAFYIFYFSKTKKSEIKLAVSINNTGGKKYRKSTVLFLKNFSKIFLGN
jgi:hypothetical protein